MKQISKTKFNHIYNVYAETGKYRHVEYSKLKDCRCEELTRLLKNAVKDLKRHYKPQLNPWMKEFDNALKEGKEVKR